MARFYVTMTDTFMSGWGCAQKKKNKLIFECDSLEEAEIVAENARNRTEMRYINIVNKVPHYTSSRYYVQVKTKGHYSSWYVPGYFVKDRKC
jgi:hypothetical protein